MSDDVLIAFLLSFPLINALVGTRGYPYGLLPQKRGGQISEGMPAFTVNGISELSHHTASDGGGPELDCFTPMRYQIDIYADSGDVVKELAHEVRIALDGFTGIMGAILIGGAWRRVTTPISRLPENLLFHSTEDYEIHSMSG